MTLEIKRRASMVLASIVAVVFAMTALLAGAAQADGEGEDTTPPALGNIDGTKTGSITVHKHAEPNSGEHADGNALDEPPANPLKKVEFSIYKINDLDVTNPDHWDTITGLKNNLIVVNKNDKGEITSVTVDGLATTMKGGPKETGDDGVVAFTGLELGVYVVVEGNDKGDNNIAVKAAPFIVTLPTPSPVKGDTDGKRYWNYDVHAYPKNSVTDITKEVSDTDAYVVGDTVDWTVTATVPLTTEKLTSFVVSDTFDSRLTYKANPGVTVTKADGTAYVKDTDYTVVVDGQKVQVKFEGDQTNKLEQGKQIIVTFPTGVNETIDEDGIIPNKATSFTNDPEQQNGVESEEVQTKWGRIKILKFDQDNNAPLKGATFQVYKTKKEADDQTNPLFKNPLVIGDDGSVISGWLNATTVVGEEQQDGRKYWVRELEAPAGYVLPADPVTEVTVMPNKTVDQIVEHKVPNTKSTVPELPLTGASGQLLMIVGGSAIILAALGLGLVAIKRRKA